MKAIAINGSPRKNWNTAQLLQSAMKGAECVGAETELINLYDLNFKGCISCFGCKRKGAEPCRCYLKDDLTPVLEKILSADALFLGSPIFFGDITGEMRKLMERLFFITMTYDDYSRAVFTGRIDAAFFFTMNVENQEHYKPIMENATAMLKRFGGETEYYAATDTLQFPDYSKYQASIFSEEQKKLRHEEQFSKDLQVAFDIGQKFVTK